MGLLSNSDPDEIIIDCGEILDISRVSDFCQELKSALGKGGEVILDATHIERIDASGLQLCTAFFQAATARKVQAKWQSPSTALITAAGLLGLSQPLGLPERD